MPVLMYGRNTAKPGVFVTSFYCRDGNFPLKNGFPLKSILASSDFVFGISGSAIKKKNRKNAIKLID